MKKVLATALILCSLFYSLQAKAASSLAHATPTVNVHLCQIFMKEYSRPLIDTVRISVPEAKQLGYLFETKKDRVILKARPACSNFRIIMILSSPGTTSYPLARSYWMTQTGNGSEESILVQMPAIVLTAPYIKRRKTFIS